MVGFFSGATGGATVNIIIRAVDNYSKEFKQLDKGIKKQEGAFKKLGKFLHSTGIGYAALATAVVTFAKITVTAALKSEQAMQQFNLKMGDVADTMLGDMRKASKGMISDFELVKNANSALALGISENQIPALLEVATARAKVFGRTASEAFNDLAIGIGRQSRLILDNLGIILDLDEAYEFYAREIGSTADELTELEKKEALVNAILRESKGLVQANIFLQETHAEKLERLAAGFDNAKVKAGEFILELYDETTGINAANEALKEHIDTVMGVPGAFDDAAQASLALSDAERDLSADLQTSNDEVKNLIDSLLNLKDVTFEGERGSNLEIANQKEVIRQLELKKARKGESISQLDEEKKKLQVMNLEADKFNKTIPDQSEVVRKLEIKELRGEDVSEQLSIEQDKLKLFRLENDEFSYTIANQKEIIRQLELEETKRGDVATQLDNEKNKLKILRLENEEFSNEREIQQAQNEIDLETIGELESTNIKVFMDGEREKIGKIIEERDNQEDLRSKIGEVQDANANLLSAFDESQSLKQEAYDSEKESIDDLINRTNKLATAYKKAARQSNLVFEEKESKIPSIFQFGGAFSGKSILNAIKNVFGKKSSVDDAIIRPNGDIIETNPNDTIFATQSPESMGGITIYIDKVQGVDADEISDMLARRLALEIRR